MDPHWRIKTLDDYRSAYHRATHDPQNFWRDVAETFRWRQPFSTVAQGDLKTGECSWFLEGHLNITENALDRHVAAQPEKLALIWEPAHPDEPALHFSYKQLLREVNRTAHMLARIGVRKGHVVTLYMPMVPELLFAVLACARLGAVHSVVFGGFSAEALAARLEDTASTVLITADGGKRGTKTVPLRAAALEALALQKPTTVQTLVTLDRGLADPSVHQAPVHEVLWHEAIRSNDTTLDAAPCASEDPLFVLYTSGSTGSPKGIVHAHAGYMVWAAYTFASVFQVTPASVHWCTADLGWITGHSYLAYGPLLMGATSVMFEGVPTWPDASRLWQVVARHQVTHLYTAPTLIRSLQGHDTSYVTQCDRSSLKVLGTVGEPINASAWHWYHDVVGEGRCPVVDTWWQTETGGIMIAPLAGISPTRPTYAGWPLPGIVPTLVDDQGHAVSDVCAGGNLCIKNPWPGMMKTIHGNFERFLNGYLRPFPGYYFTGDGALRDVDGMYRVTGRVDDVLNVSGHRLGTAELENALNKHPAVVESAVIGVPDERTGQAICAFVVLDPSSQEVAARPRDLLSELQDQATRHIGALAKPQIVYAVPGLPKTRSGKIMRRILRTLAASNSRDFGDTSTLINPEVVHDIENIVRGHI
jgi:acetyl-CoA synthetase